MGIKFLEYLQGAGVAAAGEAAAEGATIEREDEAARWAREERGFGGTRGRRARERKAQTIDSLVEVVKE